VQAATYHDCPSAPGAAAFTGQPHQRRDPVVCEQVLVQHPAGPELVAMAVSQAASRAQQVGLAVERLLTLPGGRELLLQVPEHILEAGFEGVHNAGPVAGAVLNHSGVDGPHAVAGVDQGVCEVGKRALDGHGYRLASSWKNCWVITSGAASRRSMA